PCHARTEIYTLSLHDALPISVRGRSVVHETDGQRQLSYRRGVALAHDCSARPGSQRPSPATESGKHEREPFSGREVLARVGRSRSEEHTSELQSRENLVCRLL